MDLIEIFKNRFDWWRGSTCEFEGQNKIENFIQVKLNQKVKGNTKKK